MTLRGPQLPSKEGLPTASLQLGLLGFSVFLESALAGCVSRSSKLQIQVRGMV